MSYSLLPHLSQTRGSVSGMMMFCLSTRVRHVLDIAAFNTHIGFTKQPRLSKTTMPTVQESLNHHHHPHHHYPNHHLSQSTSLSSSLSSPFHRKTIHLSTSVGTCMRRSVDRHRARGTYFSKKQYRFRGCR